MRRPLGEFGVVLGVRIGSGNHGDAVGGGEAVQARDGGHDALRAGHVQSARWKEEIELGIDIEEYGIHDSRLRRVCSINMRISRL